MMTVKSADESPFTPGIRSPDSVEKTGCKDIVFALRGFFAQARDGIRGTNYADVDSKLS